MKRLGWSLWWIGMIMAVVGLYVPVRWLGLLALPVLLVGVYYILPEDRS